MFALYADKTKLTVRSREQVTSGSVNVYQVRFDFSSDWQGLTTKAVFRGSGTAKTVLLNGSGECTIPWEVLTKHGMRLWAGVYGTRGKDTVLPTVWADLGTVLEGAAPGEESRPPAPELWEQELARKGDRLAYTGIGELGLYSGEKKLSSVPITGGGTTDPGVTTEEVNEAIKTRTTTIEEVQEMLNEVFSENNN